MTRKSFYLAFALLLALPLAAIAQKYGGPQPLSFQMKSAKVEQGNLSSDISITYPTGGTEALERSFYTLITRELTNYVLAVSDADSTSDLVLTGKIEDVPSIFASAFVDAARAQGEALIAELNEEDPSDDPAVYDPSAATPMSLDFKAQKLYANYFFASFENTGYVYLGGAHGTPITDVYTLDRETGKVLTIEDIFPAATHFKLKAIVFRHLVKDYAPEDSYWEDASSQLPEGLGVALLKEGVRFQYDAYEIGAYAIGCPTVTIPYAELTSIMSERAKRLIKN